jgi:hypothetical protein
VWCATATASRATRPRTNARSARSASAPHRAVKA